MSCSQFNVINSVFPWAKDSECLTLPRKIKAYWKSNTNLPSASALTVFFWLVFQPSALDDVSVAGHFVDFGGIDLDLRDGRLASTGQAVPVNGQFTPLGRVIGSSSGRSRWNASSLMPLLFASW